jgi:hypothetical protein
MGSEKVFHRRGTCNYERYDKTAGGWRLKGLIYCWRNGYWP